MLDRQKATEVLRLNNNNNILNDNDLENAFRRMMRRYPPEGFPEKSLEIRKAYALLSNADEYWKDFIDQENVDFSFISPYMKSSDGQAEILKKEQLELLPEKAFLQKISSPLLSKMCFEEEDIFSKMADYF